MSQENWSKFLSDNNACSDGAAWGSQQEGAVKAWDSCQNGLWMLWFIFSEPGTNNPANVLGSLLGLIRNEVMTLEEGPTKDFCKEVCQAALETVNYKQTSKLAKLSQEAPRQALELADKSAERHLLTATKTFARALLLPRNQLPGLMQRAFASFVHWRVEKEKSSGSAPYSDLADLFRSNLRTYRDAHLVNASQSKNL